MTYVNSVRFFAVLLCAWSSILGDLNRDLAARYVLKHDWKSAKASLEQALVENPHDSNVLYDLGVVLFRNGEYAQALSYFELASQSSGLDPQKNIEALYNLARTHAELHHFDEAIRIYEDILARDPHHEKSLHDLAILKQMQEKQKQDEEKQNEEEKKEKQENNKSQEKKKKNKQDQSSEQKQKQEQKEQNDQKQNQSCNNPQESQDGAQDNASKNSEKQKKAGDKDSSSSQEEDGERNDNDERSSSEKKENRSNQDQQQKTSKKDRNDGEETKESTSEQNEKEGQQSEDNDQQEQQSKQESSDNKERQRSHTSEIEEQFREPDQAQQGDDENNTEKYDQKDDFSRKLRSNDDQNKKEANSNVVKKPEARRIRAEDIDTNGISAEKRQDAIKDPRIAQLLERSDQRDRKAYKRLMQSAIGESKGYHESGHNW